MNFLENVNAEQLKIYFEGISSVKEKDNMYTNYHNDSFRSIQPSTDYGFE